MVELLLAARADMNECSTLPLSQYEQQRHGVPSLAETPLAHAAMGGSVKIVKKLLEQKADTQRRSLGTMAMLPVERALSNMRIAHEIFRWEEEHAIQQVEPPNLRDVVPQGLVHSSVSNIELCSNMIHASTTKDITLLTSARHIKNAEIAHQLKR